MDQQVVGYNSTPVLKKGQGVLEGQRRRVNLVAILQNFFAPWLLFCTLYYLMSFSAHFTNPQLVFFFAACCLVPVAVCAVMAYRVWRRKRAGVGVDDPTWYIFLTLALALAWVLAMVLGEMNYHFYGMPYYNILNLNVYPSVDVSKVRGQQAMDAGRIYFPPGTALDVRRSAGLKNKEVYCVAPITFAGQPLASYDYWAVGLNCCSGNIPDFHCGEFDNKKARAGIRLMHDEERPFYRLAVQQAEAEFQIKATHPLFFHWTQDPTAEMQGYHDDGVRYYMLGMFCHFGLSLVLVAVGVHFFSKMGYY